ncbi:ATP-binding protein [Egicoccus sp. AB-alg2]|uniref:sensor histidine kinase n=1 Tax=Egicoccus sp. AB-alg2 TaxID=3242693 RepID=UPI00359D5244
MRDPDQGLARGVSTLAAGRPRPGLPRLDSEDWIRLGAAALTPLLATLAGVDLAAGVVGALAGYVALTTALPRTAWQPMADVAAGVVLTALTRGQVLPLLPFLLHGAVRSGAAFGLRGGTAAGATLGLALVASLAAVGRLPDLGVSGGLATALLFPAVGATAASVVQVVYERSDRDRIVLQTANRLLSSLRSMADHLPGGLDVATVSAALVAEVRALAGPRAVLVLVEEHGLLEPAAAAGLAPGAGRRVRLDELRGRAATSASGARFLTPQALPAALRPATAAARHWTVLALGTAHSLAGVLLVGFDDLDRGRALRPRLASIAADGGLALDNARLFDGTQSRAADAARRRLAGDLHDGVAQSLAHLSMELELRALTATLAPEDAELARLARLARHTLEELRATITDLRLPTEGDIDVQLRRHVDRLTSATGPTLEFVSYGRAPVASERAEQVLRVAQEALSNAVRHAAAERVTVTLERDTSVLELTVEDDGVGLTDRSPQAGGGVGMRTMRERASLLGGSLAVRPRVGGGTVVHLRCPTSTQATRTSGRPR